MSRAEIEHLYRAVLPAVRHALEHHGELTAFGAALCADGDVVRVEPRSAGHDGGPAEHVLAVHAAVQSLAAAREVLAACVCTAVTLEPDDVGDAPDGVRIHIEDTGAEEIDVLLPHRQDGAGGVEYGEPVAQEAPRRLLRRAPERPA